MLGFTCGATLACVCCRRMSRAKPKERDMKRLIWIASAAGLMWTAPALGEEQRTAAAPQDQATNTVQAQAQKHSGDGPHDKAKDVRDQRAETMSHQVANHTEHAKRAQGDRVQHDAAARAMSHAGGDGNAAHADVANQAAMHMAPSSRSQTEYESHDAAGHMGTAHEHGGLRGMEEGGGRMHGSQGGR
jgi:hypothetical protein